MYRCEICKSVVPPNTPSTRIVVETRPKEYPTRSDRSARNSKRSNRFQQPSDIGGKGFEIVREIVVCPICARKQRTEQPEVAGQSVI